MNEIEKQILQGLTFLIRKAPEEKGIDDMMFKKMWINKTEQLLNPKIEGAVCDMEEDRICGACGNPLGSDKGCDKCEEYERQGESRE